MRNDSVAKVRCWFTNSGGKTNFRYSDKARQTLPMEVKSGHNSPQSSVRALRQLISRTVSFSSSRRTTKTSGIRVNSRSALKRRSNNSEIRVRTVNHSFVTNVLIGNRSVLGRSVNKAGRLVRLSPGNKVAGRRRQRSGRRSSHPVVLQTCRGDRAKAAIFASATSSFERKSQRAKRRPCWLPESSHWRF